MFIWKINKKEVKVPENWSEITFSEYDSIWMPVINKMPNDVQEYYKSEPRKRKKLEQDIDWTQFHSWIREFICTITKVESKVIDEAPVKDIRNFYNIMEPFVTGGMYGVGSVMVEPCKEFLFKSEKYLCATDKINLIGQTEPMGNAKFGEFVEALQINQSFKEVIEKNNFKYIPFIIACLWRKEGEVYDDKLVIERGNGIFRELPMSIIWGCAFFLTQHITTYIKNISQLLSQRMGAEGTKFSKVLDGLQK